ncbi:MAG: hypothetical protein IT320_03610 [Anaerolineae bacterium]|nr:hypothetical protein [Anaerolineae bacterium]
MYDPIALLVEQRQKDMAREAERLRLLQEARIAYRKTQTGIVSRALAAVGQRLIDWGTQLTLEAGEARRLNPLPPGIRILSGRAWLSWKGKDIVLNQGQEYRFQSGGDEPVISSVGQHKIVIEVVR